MTPVNYQTELYRPQYHFTPAEKWINDPNGLVYYDGEYHLFYQYHPGSLIWGPMHWGHAVSPDMVHWEHLSIALYPDELGTIFSGSAVIDWHNTAGFGKEAMIAVYTYHDDTGVEGPRQSQAIAYSTDKGRTWTKYAGNPVIPVNPAEKDFRDPKVFWVMPAGEADEDGYWMLLLAVDDSIWFFRSTNLKNWEKVSEFGEGQGAHAGVWETPDLFRLAVDGTDEMRWVLTVGIGRGAPAGGSGMQYFVGDFDGTMFTSENPAEVELWADYGADFYAAQGWTDAPNGRKLWIAWMNNWDYAREIPTPTWRGAMSLPRELGLHNTADGLRIVQKPVVELQPLRTSSMQWQNERIVAGGADLLSGVSGEALEIIADFDLSGSSATQFGFQVRQGLSEQTTIRYDVVEQTCTIDRTQAGVGDFNPAFPKAHSALLCPIDGTIRLHLFIDRSSVELFGNDGLLSMTERIFPNPANLGVTLFTQGGELVVPSLAVHELSSIWAG